MDFLVNPIHASCLFYNYFLPVFYLAVLHLFVCLYFSLQPCDFLEDKGTVSYVFVGFLKILFVCFLHLQQHLVNLYFAVAAMVITVVILLIVLNQGLNSITFIQLTQISQRLRSDSKVLKFCVITFLFWTRKILRYSFQVREGALFDKCFFN